MGRVKVSPAVKAFYAVAALSESEQVQFEAMLIGWRARRGAGAFKVSRPIDEGMPGVGTGKRPRKPKAAAVEGARVAE